MTPSSIRVLFQIFVCALAISSEIAGASDLDAQVTHVKNFLCARSFCVKQDVTVAQEPSEGYYAYFHAHANRISLSPNLTDTETQLDLVHEFTHIYRHSFNNDEEVWLDEGLAKFMEYQYAGGVWPFLYEKKLRQNPELILGNDRKQGYGVEGIGYPSSFWMVLYLYNHFGGDKLIAKLMSSSKAGWANVESALADLRANGDIAEGPDLLTRDAIVRHFAIAVAVNDEFKAQFNLFSLDPRHEPLTSALPAPQSFDASAGVAIVYSKRYAPSRAREVYAVRDGIPSAVSGGAVPTADLFVFIF